MRLRIISIILVILAMGGLSGAEPKGTPNLIIISVDTLRADRLGCYGYSRNTSPNIDKLVARGTLFMNAICQVPLTTPSFCSMMTSRYPHQTGSMRNGIPMLPENESLAQILEASGYNTAAVLSNWPLKAHLSGLEPGFDLYDDDFHQKRWLIFNDERDAEGVSDNAIKWLKDKPGEPFFLWVHYSEPHSPYLHHKEFSFREKGVMDTDRVKSDDYDSEVAYADHHIGRLIKVIDSMDLARRSLMVFVADHGESLGEHKYWGHGRKVYQPCLHVPFAMLGPDIPVGQRILADVQLLDLAPTVLSYLGIPKGEQMMGLDILPHVRRSNPFPQRTLYYETYPGALPLEEMRDMKQLNKPIYAGLKRGDYKLMYSIRYQRWESYDLGTDPGESTNLFNVTESAYIQDSQQLLDWYNAWKDHGLAIGQTDQMTDEDRQRFEALGYVDK